MRIVLLTILTLLTVLGSLSTATYAYAQYDSDTVVVSEADVVAQEGRAPEANLPFLFAVFFITWGAFFVYIFFMSRRQREMQREIDALKRAIAAKEREAEQSAPS